MLTAYMRGAFPGTLLHQGAGAGGEVQTPQPNNSLLPSFHPAEEEANF
jgi:hypothetical protein